MVPPVQTKLSVTVTSPVPVKYRRIRETHQRDRRSKFGIAACDRQIAERAIARDDILPLTTTSRPVPPIEAPLLIV